MTSLPQRACSAPRFVIFVLTFAFLLDFEFCAGGMAQTAPAPPPPPISALAQKPLTSAAENSQETIRIPDGTLVYLWVNETVSSKTAKPGDPVKLQVFGDVKIGDLVVIADKAPVSGTIESVKTAGRAWRAGRLFLKLNTVTLLNQQQQPLRAVSAVKGTATVASADWTEAAIFLLGLPFANGNEASLDRGMVLDAVIDEDVLLPRSEIEALQPQSAVQPEPATPRHGPATVTFYYPDFGHGPFSAYVWCGEIEIGELLKGGMFTVSLPAGRYFLRFGKKGNPVVTTLDVQESGEQYVAVKVSPEQQTGSGKVWWQPHFSLVPHDVGKAQSAYASTSRSVIVKDVAKMNRARLQAEPSAEEAKKN
jgi:hypothetical protein